MTEAINELFKHLQMEKSFDQEEANEMIKRIIENKHLNYFIEIVENSNHKKYTFEEALVNVLSKGFKKSLICFSQDALNVKVCTNYDLS